jgi:endogenous inhibitor of DNA gyrase (YacG/DUF329 family)
MAGPPEPEKVELCVLCRRHPVDPDWRPFCSERCRLQDLARWADESYRVPAEPVDVDGTGAPAQPVEKVTDPDG